MPNRKTPRLGTLMRRSVSLITALTFLVLSVTGVLAFIQPFSIDIIGLHALMGFIFIGLVGLHVFNNSRPLTSYLRSKALWAAITLTATLTLLFWWQPAPVKTVLGWSGNLGPAMERFEMGRDGMTFHYSPSGNYKMRLDVRTGPSFPEGPPPQVAIWLENHDGYHIKTLLAPTDRTPLPYWSFKHAGWEKAKREAQAASEIDAITSPTPLASFDPAVYIVPRALKDATPYQLMLEIDQAGDGQPSLIYSVEIDNGLPRSLQLLELRGYPKRDDGETWSLYYVDESFSTALDLIDSALLTIQRSP
jgi:hypothetical protein